MPLLTGRAGILRFDSICERRGVRGEVRGGAPSRELVRHVHVPAHRAARRRRRLRKPSKPQPCAEQVSEEEEPEEEAHAQDELARQGERPRPRHGRTGVRRAVPGVHCTCKHACKRARNRRVRIQHARAPWRSVLSEGRRTALWLTLSLSLLCLAVLSQARYCRGLGASRAVACVGDPR